MSESPTTNKPIYTWGDLRWLAGGQIAASPRRAEHIRTELREVHGQMVAVSTWSSGPSGRSWAGRQDLWQLGSLRRKHRLENYEPAIELCYDGLPRQKSEHFSFMNS